MTSAAKRKSDAKHPDQLDEVILAKPMPVQVQPRGPARTHGERAADVAARIAELRGVARELRDAQNAMVREWLRHHLVAGTSQRLAAREVGLEALPAALFLAMYHAAKPLAPTAASDVLTTALNWLVRTIRVQRSPRSNLRRWMAVLAPSRSERVWHFDEPQPIRLSAATCQFEDAGGKVCVAAKVLKGQPPIRLLVKGECGATRPGGPGRNGRQYNERLRLLCTTLAANGAMLTEVRGQWQFTFLERRAAPRLPVRDDLRTMFVRASAQAGWRVRLAGASALLIEGERLADLADARRRQIARRSELRARGVAAQSKQAQTQKQLWANYCRTLNQQTVAEIVSWCERHGVERIAVMAGDDWCALGSAGNDDLEKSEPTRFPFAEFAALLHGAAMRAGIVVSSRANLRSVKRRKDLWRRKLAMEQVEAAGK